MAIQKTLVCDSCGNRIGEDDPHIPKGFAFVGNVHVADAREEDGVGGGLIGNNLKKISSYTAVGCISHMCIECTFAAMLGHGYEVKIYKRGTALDY